MDELRRSFTLDGKPVPPLVFRDLGDGNLADTKAMLVTADVRAAIGSNRYSASIGHREGWVTQTSDAEPGTDGAETLAYRFLGTTPAGLIVVLTSDSPAGGSGEFRTLHVLDPTVSSALDQDGRRYDRVNVTTIWGYPLGDRTSVEATLSGDTVTLRSRDAGQSGAPAASAATRTLKVSRP